jgi:hypothetical protein
MTTNRMGLEQTLSDERLEFYTSLPSQPFEKGASVFMYEVRDMARELRTRRKAAGEPVAYMTYKGYLLHAADPKVAEYSEPTPLYEAPPIQAVPAGWKMVPVEPTENMVVEGFESEPDSFFSHSDEWEAYKAMSGCEQAAHKARLCWAAMIAAAPSVTNEP